MTNPMTKIERSLQEYSGFRSFRSGQKELTESVLQGKMRRVDRNAALALNLTPMGCEGESASDLIWLAGTGDCRHAIFID